MATGSRKRRRGLASSQPPSDAVPAQSSTVNPSAPTDVTVPPPFSFKSNAAPATPQSLLVAPHTQPEKPIQQQPHVDADSALLALPAVPGPPPPPARPLLRFDAPFTLLDDDIDDTADEDASTNAALATAPAVTRRVGGKRGRSPIEGVIAVRRSGRHQQRGVRNVSQEAPPTPSSAEAMVPSSLPSSPVSPDSSAPTAVNSPANQTTAIGGRQLIDELSLIMQRQQPRGAEGREAVPVTAAAGTSTATDSTKGRATRQKKAVDDENEETARKQRRGGGGKAAGKREKQTSGTYFDTTNAQDIRAFLSAASNSLQAPAFVNAHAPAHPADKLETVAEAVTPSAPPSPSATPPRPPAPVPAMLYPPLLIRSPHVDIAAIRKKFGLEKSEESSSMHGPTTADTNAPLLQDERKESQSEHASMDDSAISGRVDAVNARPGKRKRDTDAIEAINPAAAVGSGGIVAHDSVKGEQLGADTHALRTTSTMPFSPTSPLLPLSTFAPIRSDLSRHPTLTDEQLDTQYPTTAVDSDSMVVDDSSNQKLERASTIIVHNNNAVDEVLPLIRPTPLHPIIAGPRVGDESILRQASLTSTTSSTSTASADASTRVPSSDSASSSPSALSPCERLPSTFPDFQCERLSTRTGAYTLCCFAVTTTGSVRQKNQDAFAVLASHPDRAAEGKDSICILSVFDGHGALGHTASRLCAASMPSQVATFIAAEPAMDDAKEDTAQQAVQRIEQRLSGLRRSFDSCQQLLLDVARAEQEYIATLLTKLQPDMHITATRTCQPMHSPHQPSPPSSPSLLFPRPPLLAKSAVYDSMDLLPLPDLDDLSIPPLVALRRHEPHSHDDDDIHNTQQLLLQTDGHQPLAGDSNIALPPAEETALAHPVPERRKKKGRRRPLSKPRKHASPTPRQAQHQQIRVDGCEQSAATGPLVSHSDSESETERKNSAADESSLSSHPLQPIQRSPVKRVALKQTRGKASPRQKPTGLTARSADAAGPVAVDVDYGTTGLMVIIEGADVYVANTGDSRCVLLEWRGSGGAKRNGSDAVEVEAKEQPVGLFARPLGTRRRARSPPSISTRVRSGGAGVVSRSLSSPSASFSSTVPAPTSSFQSSSGSPWRTLFTSGDHDPSLATPLGVSEYERVRCEGGSVLQLPGQYRVYPDTLTVAEAKRRALTLNMSRALGHLMLSQHGVIHTPDCTHIALGDESSNEEVEARQEVKEDINDSMDGSTSGSGSGSEVWMVLASDGLWDVMDVDEVRAAIDQQRRHQHHSGTGGGGNRVGGSGEMSGHGCKGLRGNGMCLECVCCSLLQSSEARWQTRGGGDNITIVLVQLTKAAR